MGFPGRLEQEEMGSYDVRQEVTDKYSLRGRVFNKLRAHILSGKYAEHEELKEMAIGDEMRDSRTPVREALRALAAEGWVEIRQGIGAYVKPLSTKEMEDLYEVRCLLETHAVRTSAFHITSEEILPPMPTAEEPADSEPADPEPKDPDKPEEPKDSE